MSDKEGREWARQERRRLVANAARQYWWHGRVDADGHRREADPDIAPCSAGLRYVDD